MAELDEFGVKIDTPLESFRQIWTKVCFGKRKMQSHQLKIASLPHYQDIRKYMHKKKSPTIVELFVVEIVGVEPTTPCLQSRCSSQLSYTPILGSPEQT